MDVVRNRMRGARQQHSSSDSSIEKAQCAAENMIEERPVLTALAAFGIGMGLGAAVGAMISDWVFESLDTRSDFEKITQNVMDRVSGMVPDVVSRHFHK